MAAYAARMWVEWLDVLIALPDVVCPGKPASPSRTALDMVSDCPRPDRRCFEMSRMMMWNVPVAVALSAMMISSANAACPGETQMEMNECAGIAYDKADKRLNQVYRKLERTPELVAAQRAWIAFRDAESNYQASAHEGGSMQPMIYAGSLQSLTEDRIEQLEQASQQQ